MNALCGDIAILPVSELSSDCALQHEHDIHLCARKFDCSSPAHGMILLRMDVPFFGRRLHEEVL